MAKVTFKKPKLEERILSECNSFLRGSSNDPRLKFVSVTRVELTSDYSYATLSWDTFESKKRGDAKKAIEGVVPRLRTHLAKILKMRKVPEVIVKYDSQYDAQKKIEDILHEANESVTPVGEDISSEDES